jgi:hypothetical protein
MLPLVLMLLAVVVFLIIVLRQAGILLPWLGRSRQGSQETPAAVSPEALPPPDPPPLPHGSILTQAAVRRRPWPMSECATWRSPAVVCGGLRPQAEKSPSARLTARTTASSSIGGTRPRGPSSRNSWSIVVNSSQNSTLSYRRPVSSAGMTTRVGPRFPREKMGTTMICSRVRLRTSAETTKTKRGWCGSRGWPGVYASHTSPRRGSVTR